MSAIEISIVSPVYNEEGNIKEFILRTSEVLDSLQVTYEILMVNDGSTDQSESLLNAQALENTHVRPVHLTRNCGQWAAIYAGMQESKGRYVVVMDSDLQHSPNDLPALYSKIKEGYTLVSGCRQKRQDNFLLRRLPSRIANYLLRKITTCPSRDLGGFKCIEGNMARSLHLKAGYHRLLPALVWLKGGTVVDVPVSSNPRFSGQSHYGLSRSLDVLFDIILFWFQNSFKARQMYLFGYLSLLTFLGSVGLLAWVSFDKLVYDISLTNRPAFFVGCGGFLVAFQLISLGFILEMLSTTQNEITKSKPYYIRR